MIHMSNVPWNVVYMYYLLGFSKTAFFVMGCVYIDTCSTILPGEVITYNFKNITGGLVNFFARAACVADEDGFILSLEENTVA